MALLREGDPAPDFTAAAHSGSPFTLSEYRGRQVVVLFFYPQDGTPLCTRQACAFRDRYTDFLAAGAIVVGVSGDTLESHRQFAEASRLPFILLSDEQGAIRRQFGVTKSLGVLPARVTYVIDKLGIVRLVFQSAFTATRHVSQALAMVKRLASEPA